MDWFDLTEEDNAGSDCQDDCVTRVEAHVEAIELISSAVVEQAAQEVVSAAVAARRRELVEERPYPDGRVSVLDLATGDRYVPVTEGWYNPVTGVVVPTDPQEVDRSEYDWLVDKFRYFHERSQSLVSNMIGDCLDAKREMQSGTLSAVDGVKRAVEIWGGEARNAFLEFFLDPLDLALANQQAVLDELTVAMYAYDALLRQGRLSTKELADQTVNVLDGLHTANFGRDEASILLGIVGAVATAIASIGSGGTAAALTAGLIAAGVDATSVGQEIADRVTIGGMFVDEVMHSLEGALDGLRQAMDREEKLLAEAVERQTDEVWEFLASDHPLHKATILPNEPSGPRDQVTNLTDGEIPTPDEFRPRS